MTLDVSRRTFIAASAVSTALAANSARGAGENPMSTPKICIFSKHLQFLDYTALAKTCKDIGVDGVDLAVRRGAHVEPSKVAEDLPRAVEAIRAQGLEVPMITTALYKGDDPDAWPILSAASKLGIRYFRIGGQKYGETGSPAAELPRVAAELKGLAAKAKELNMYAAYHNHSGANNVGAPVWDLFTVFRELGLDSLGSSFDVAHATIEGGMAGWNLSARLMAPYTKVMAVKDFAWRDNEAKWLPLGEGQVKVVPILKIMKANGFAGPISMHFEYKTASNEALIDEMRKAAVTLRGFLGDAGYA
jgi:sugar phosphate isomerase/epimerase